MLRFIHLLIGQIFIVINGSLALLFVKGGHIDAAELPALAFKAGVVPHVGCSPLHPIMSVKEKRDIRESLELGEYLEDEP